jgi:diguanylate cyclase (GGDEF)-like protein/PAS domain S-box-containing protein
MTMIFQPPVPDGRGQGFADLWRIGDADDAFWSDVRRGQIGYIARYLPLVSLVMAVNGAIAVLAFEPVASARVLGIWLLVNAALSLLWVGRSSIDFLLGVTNPAKPPFMRALLVEMTVVGTIWGYLFLHVLSNGGAAQAPLVVVVAMGTLCAMFRSTAIFPLGTVALVTPVAIGLLLGLVAAGPVATAAPAALLVGFLLLAVRGNLLTSIEYLGGLHTGRRLREQEEVVRLLLNEYDSNGSEWLFEFDAEGTVSFVSSRFAEVTGQSVEQVIGSRWMDALTDLEAARPLVDMVRRGQPYRDFLLPIEIAGEQRWWSLSGTPKFGREGQLLGYRGVGSDVTDRQLSARHIAELATFDALTGLANRRVVHQALADGLKAGTVALLFIDLDRFKAVNDSLGHGAGDRLLGDVAARLRDMVAPAAGTDALVGRLGGDEFAVVLRNVDAKRAVSIGQGIIARLSTPYQLGDARATIGASIGLALGPDDGTSVEALMRAADLALYDVKSNGRGSVRAYDRAMHSAAEDRRALELDLKCALDQGQLRLVFQPVVDAMDERIVGFEALLRWRHPLRGDISPAVFVPIAEDAGLIGRIGAWVLNEACRVAAGWPRSIKIAVNLSPLQFDDPAFVETVEAALARWKLPPNRLELEITESVFLDERPQTSAMLARLQGLGIDFALDDFGTGYSSLGYLQKIAFRRIKIDRSFVQGSASQTQESTAIVQAIVALAERLGMETTAEGTETREEFEAMRRLGCGQMQGWYFGRPVPAEETARLLARRRPLVELAAAEAPAAEPFRRRRQPRSPAASARSPAVAARAMAPLP